MTRLAACGALILMSHTAAFGGDKTLMHCFAWTPVKDATAADWDAFYKASDALPQKIQGVIRVWYGKLASPLRLVAPGKMDDAAMQKLRAGETVTAPISVTAREYGMCIEMKDADALKVYTSDPYHKIWNDAYAKVRVEGTTTFNILGQ
jgi:hypothetical protein